MWTREGKTWSKRSLSGHLNSLKINYATVKEQLQPLNIKPKRHWSDVYKDCEIVEFTESSTASMNARLFIETI